MIIDLIKENGELIRYMSDFCPRVGESVTSIQDGFAYRIKDVDHLLAENVTGKGEPGLKYLQRLVTCNVEKIQG